MLGNLARPVSSAPSSLKMRTLSKCIHLTVFVSQKRFLYGKKQTCSETLSIPDAVLQGSQLCDSTPVYLRPQSLGHTCAQEAPGSRLSPGFRDAETLFNARPGSWSPRERDAPPSTCAFRWRGGRGGRVPGPPGTPRQGSPRVASGRLLLPLKRASAAARGGGRVARRTARLRAQHPAFRDCTPAAERGSRSPARVRPRRRGKGGTRRAGALASPREPPRPVWAAHPFLPAPGWPAADQETRQETRGRPGPAGRECGPPSTHIQGRPAGAGFKGELPTFPIQSLLSPPPPCHRLLGDPQVSHWGGVTGGLPTWFPSKFGVPNAIEEIQKRTVQVRCISCFFLSQEPEVVIQLKIAF